MKFRNSLYQVGCFHTRLDKIDTFFCDILNLAKILEFDGTSMYVWFELTSLPCRLPCRGRSRRKTSIAQGIMQLFSRFSCMLLFYSKRVESGIRRLPSYLLLCEDEFCRLGSRAAEDFDVFMSAGSRARLGPALVQASSRCFLEKLRPGAQLFSESDTTAFTPSVSFKLLLLFNMMFSN